LVHCISSMIASYSLAVRYILPAVDPNLSQPQFMVMGVALALLIQFCFTALISLLRRHRIYVVSGFWHYGKMFIVACILITVTVIYATLLSWMGFHGSVKSDASESDKEFVSGKWDAGGTLMVAFLIALITLLVIVCTGAYGRCLDRITEDRLLLADMEAAREAEELAAHAARVAPAAPAVAGGGVAASDAVAATARVDTAVESEQATQAGNASPLAMNVRPEGATRADLDLQQVSIWRGQHVAVQEDGRGNEQVSVLTRATTAVPLLPPPV
jgi:hypothetical protein